MYMSSDKRPANFENGGGAVEGGMNASASGGAYAESFGKVPTGELSAGLSAAALTAASRPGVVYFLGVGEIDYLTPREWQVLGMVAAGSDRPRIAACLGISTNAVGEHLRSAKSRLSCGRRMDPVAEARRRGYMA